MPKFTKAAALVAFCCALQCQGFVDRSPVHYSYRYNICPAQARGCGAQGSLTPTSFESSPRTVRYLRHKTPEGSNGFVLFAGEGEADLVEKVKQVVSEQLGADISKITPQSHFIKDLEADSLDSVELVMAFEEKFGVTIPDTEATKITTVQEAVDYIQKHKN